jgi:arylsulfatase A-like enzyme
MKPCLAAFAFVMLVAVVPADAAEKPNIVIILTDDQGYADISFNPQHPPEVSTPNMDALAREGIFFNQAYLSGNVCSPTRAGLMLGRYQQRVGVYTAGEGGSGFDPKLPIFPAFLPKEYVSTAIGKWHLGLDTDYPELKWHALSRGFDECYKFMGRGAHDYYQLKGASGTHDTGPIYRNKQRIDDEGYLTHRLTEEAVHFIKRQKHRPFFLYLAYNAVHAPKQAPPEDIARFRKQFPDISESRVILMAMLHHLDQGVGQVVKTLKQEGVWDNTLLFFFTDNGGAKAMEANNTPLRGFKGSNYEGGLRTPFVVSWPAKLKGARQIDTPIISLDVLPTVLDALDVTPPAGIRFDGKSLLPVLRGQKKVHHAHLFWSTAGDQGQWAIRSGDWKLLGTRAQRELFNLSADPGETNNLASQQPARVAQLTKLHDAWLDQMAEPMKKGVGKRWRAEKPELTERQKQRLERKKQRQKK